jgi:TRAP-type C4-dicarboxylate transport system substrate-binding protein
MRRILTMLAFVLAFVATAPVAAVATGEEPTSWDMPMAYSASNFHSRVAADFATDVAQATAGSLQITPHPSGALFGGAEIYDAVRRGQAPIGERLIAALSEESPLFALDSLPFLATSYDSAWKLYQTQKPHLQALLKERGLVFLYAGPWPPQGLYSVRRIDDPQDLEGLKFRAYNRATMRIGAMFGAEPTLLETAQTALAFSTGAAQVMISSGSVGLDFRLWEHVDYFYNVQAWMPKNMVFVNLEAFNALTSAQQAALFTASAKAEEMLWAQSEALSDWYLTQFRALGVKVEPAPAALKAKFEKIGGELMAQWLEEAGEVGTMIVEAYSKM